MVHPFCHMELSTSSLASSKEFYSGLFGWQFTDNDMGDGVVYSLFRPEVGPGGGVFAMPGLPNFWLPYVGVDEIHAATEKAVALGAAIQRGPQEVPGMGWFTVLSDPNGAAIALWEATGLPRAA